MLRHLDPPTDSQGLPYLDTQTGWPLPYTGILNPKKDLRIQVNH